MARGKYLLLLNSDTLVEKDNLQKMVSYFETVPDDVICIGPKILNYDGTIQSSGYPNPGLRERFCMCFKLHKLLPVSIVELIFRVKGFPHNSNIVREVGWVSGSCMMIRAKEYKMIGGLNENIEFYGEEPEFGYRSKKHHYRTIYYPNAEIIHLGGQSSSKKVDEEIRLRRYALLQRETVGYSKSIWMSRIVLCAAYLKKIVLPNKASLLQAIEWEKKVIDYLRKVKDEETSH